MLARLFLLFTLVPLVELALLIRLGGWIGALPTVGLVAATGLTGAWLARREGLRSWTAVQRELSRGRVPGSQLLHTLLIVVAGVFLVTPGVLTDALGLGLLVPPGRRVALRMVRGWLTRQVGASGTAVFWTSKGGGTPGDGWASGGAGGPEDGEGPGTDAPGEVGGEGGPSGWRRRPPPDDGDDGGDGGDGTRRGRRVVEM